MRQGHAIAVITRHTNLSMMRTPSRLELTYLATADALSRMVAAGEFPNSSAPTGLRRGAPRAGDGVVRLDYDGVITYASPNAVSAIHRLGWPGEVMGGSMSEIVTSVLRDSSPVDEGLPLVLTGRQPWRTEVGSRGRDRHDAGDPADRGGAAVRRAAAAARRQRAAPPRAGAAHQGRDDPRDPPPGEEQPAVGRRPAPAAGPAYRRRAGPRRAPGGRATGGHHRARPRHPEQGVRRDRRLRRGRRPGVPRGRRGGRLRQADRAGAHRRLVRPAARRGRHVARDDPQRAGPERHRARLPGRHRRHRHGRRQTGGRASLALRTS